MITRYHIRADLLDSIRAVLDVLYVRYSIILEEQTIETREGQQKQPTYVVVIYADTEDGE